MKMKKFILTLTLIIFLPVILLRPASALVTSEITVIPTPTETPAKVDYFLAYPGILPDNFLYPVKMIRDRIWLFLTTDSLKKAETLLLFADKRLGAGKALIEGNKVSPGLTTLSKAEKYLEQALNQEKMAGEEGKDTRAFLEKLSLATRKHQEVLGELREKLGESERPSLDGLLHYSQDGYQAVLQRLSE
jgi:hypothetical protein